MASQRFSKKAQVGVLYGGLSSEREISIQTGKAMSAALKKKGYVVSEIEVKKDIVSVLAKTTLDVAVIGLHGKMGEDGSVQGLLEMIGVPYTGSGVMASAIAMNKILTKKIAQAEKVLTPDFWIFHKHESLDAIRSQIKLPVVVKSQAEGSTRGTVVVKSDAELEGAVQEATRFDDWILIESFIEGPELTVSLLNGKAFPAIEIVPKSGFYDYDAKYTKGATDYIIPARVNKEIEQKAAEGALTMYRVLQCRGCARADFMVDSAGVPWFIEMNTLPGLTETSLVPKAVAHEGMSFENLVEEILQAARCDHEKISQKA